MPGDALFEVCYQPDFRASARALRDQYAGSFAAFWADFRSRPAFTKESDGLLLNDWCMAACYSTDPDGTVRLPYDPATGALVPEVWERWLAWDPVRMAPRYAAALRGLRAVYIDAGTHDEAYLDLGAEAFRRVLTTLGVSDLHFELFEAGHYAIEYRYPARPALPGRAPGAVTAARRPARLRQPSELDRAKVWHSSVATASATWEERLSARHLDATGNSWTIPDQ